MKCDFCSAPDPTWAYPANTFIAFEEHLGQGESVGAISHGGWAACDVCHALIEAGDQQGIAKRSLDELLMEHTEMIMATDELLVEMVALHRSFFDNRCGAGIPYVAAP
jgi:hypothetical protein